MTDPREQIAHINALARGFMNSEVLFAANEAGVFAYIEEPRAAADVAANAGWDARAARMLLDALVALGLVLKKGDLYHNAPAASACLVPGSPAYQGNIVKHLHYTASGWHGLAEALRTGKGVGEGRAQRPPDEIRAFILGMNDIAKSSAKELLGALDLSPYRSFLDVGGGPATYAIAFLEAHPAMKAAVFDLPDVIPIAREQVLAAHLERRVAFIAGDMLADAFGSGYDLILLSNIIHSFGIEKNRALVRKCFDALDPGGMLILKDFLTDNDRSGPAYSLMFALHMLVGSGEGDTYSFAQVAEWTREAGFEDGRAVDLTPQSRLWLVKKPYPKHQSSLIGFLDKTPPSKLRHGDFTPEE